MQAKTQSKSNQLIASSGQYAQRIYKKAVFIFIFLMILQSVNADYANDWAVEIAGGDGVAQEVADLHGFQNLGKVFPDSNFYHFQHSHVKKRHAEISLHHQLKLDDHPKVLWSEQQKILSRKKRDINIINVPFSPDTQGPNDKMWNNMWYLHTSTTPNMKVVEAWDMGATGKDIVVTILDDGIEHDHPDLMENYDSLASSDINSNDDDPEPRTTFNNENRHGTRCAGEVAAVANNNICSVGVAFHAKIGGVRMLDGDVTDMVEARSIGLRPQHVEIYSASWGPDDDGKTVDGPAKLARKAFEDGVKLGRQKKGSIFVWASGNGGRYGDNCNCDGYTNSIYTLSISSVTQSKNIPWYSEACSSTLATTYSSGAGGEGQIVTTDLNKGCTDKHTGTSASAPMAAGVCALALEANRDLTWRDMQHIVVRTANSSLLNAEDWKTNGAGRKVSHAYGYGLLDAAAMVKLARTWENVGEQHKCTISVISSTATPRKFSTSLTVPVDVSGCDDASPIIYKLEHVLAKLSVHSDRRGDLEIYLTSPMKTKSMLLGKRRGDYSSSGFNEWSFMTTHSWDETATGRWTLTIENHSGPQSHDGGVLTSFDLILYGTTAEKQPSTNTTTTTTTVSTTTTATTTKGEFKNLLQNCQVPSRTSKSCLVCDSNYVLEPSSGHCLASCPPSFYTANEKVVGQMEVLEQKNSKKKKTVEAIFEENQEDEFEEEERIGGHVCRPCKSKLCHTCIGGEEADCLQCMTGSKMGDVQGICVQISAPIVPKTPHKNVSHIKKIVILLCVASVVVFLVLLFIINMCSRKYRYGGGVGYKTVNNEDDDDDVSESDVPDERMNKYFERPSSVSLPSTPINGNNGNLRIYKDEPRYSAA